MIALDLAGGALARQTVRTAEFLRAEELGSVPGDQGPSAQPAEGLPHRRARGVEFPGVRSRAAGERGPPRRVADVIVGGNSADAEQRLAARVGKSRGDGPEFGEKGWQELYPNPESDFC